MKDFEARLARLEEIATLLRDGKTGIDEATRVFEEGVHLSRQLEKDLRDVERRVELLVDDPSAAVGPEHPSTVPFQTPAGDV